MLPDRDNVRVDRDKIVNYLLSFSHPDGRSKADFFSRFGFTVEDWKALADALCAVGVSYPVVGSIESTYGVRYTVDGILPTPDGRGTWVRTVWIVEAENSGPRLITAYPIVRNG